MKATLIITAFILFASFMGCSENFNVTDPSNKLFEASSQNRPDDGSINQELVWVLNELNVTAGSEFGNENKASFINQAVIGSSAYMITFDVYTNADRFTNGYTPLVQVIKDEDAILLQSSDFPDKVGDVISHVKLDVEYSMLSNVSFRVALIQADNVQPASNDDAACVLQLSNIKVYRIY